MIEYFVAFYISLLAIVCVAWVGVAAMAAAFAPWRAMRRWVPMPEGFGERRSDPQLRMDCSLPAQAAERTFRPSVSLIVTAIEGPEVDRLVRLLSLLEYPADRLEIHIIVAGPLLRLRAELREFSNVTLHDSDGSRRRDLLVNRVVPLARGEILVFMDSRAAIAPDALRLLVRHFAHPRVECVAAERRLCDGGSATGFFARLRSFDARLWTVAGPFSELFAMRSRFFEPTGSDPMVEDFRLAVRLAAKDGRAVRETQALVPGEPVTTSAQIALCTSRLRMVLRPGTLWRFGRHGLVGISHWAHRALRCAVAPLAFFLAIPLGALLAIWHPVLVLPVAFQLFLVALACRSGAGEASRGSWAVQVVWTAGAALAAMLLMASGRTGELLLRPIAAPLPAVKGRA